MALKRVFVDTLNPTRLKKFIMNIFYKNFVGSLMKKTDPEYVTFPGLCPTTVRPSQDMPGPAVGPGPISVIGIY